MRGFKPPPPGTRMCRELVAHDVNGKLLDRPRPCKRAADDGSDYCGRHAVSRRGRAPVEVRDGGFCVCCGGAARSYVVESVTVALCGAHGRALVRAIREGR